MKDKETLYARWLSGELNDEELALLKEEGSIDALERIIETTDSWQLSKYNKADGLKRVKEKQGQGQTKAKNINLKWFVAIAASFLLVFGLFQYRTNNAVEVRLATNGTNAVIPLVDGSIVTLNDGSSIEYVAKNWETERTITLAGEALFAVEKGSPFLVNTVNGSVQVLGTKFNVRAWGANLFVECYEGSVAVQVGNDQRILKGGEGLNVIAGTLSETHNLSNTTALWEQGTSRFFNENINDVFFEMERQFDITIKCPKMKRPFSGIFPHDDLDKALKKVCLPLGLKFTLSANKKEVLIE